MRSTLFAMAYVVAGIIVSAILARIYEKHSGDEIETDALFLLSLGTLFWPITLLLWVLFRIESVVLQFLRGGSSDE